MFSIQPGDFRSLAICTFAAALALVSLTGCETTATTLPASQTYASEPQSISEGDGIKITFPGTQGLDTEQRVRRDGMVTIPMLGEIKAAGKTPSDLEKELLGKYSSQLVSKEVSVTIVSSQFAVFVSGAVNHPGKITSDHPLSALEAVMEAGGFDSSKANMATVTIIRTEGGKTKNFTINLKEVLDGRANDPFYLKPSDIIVVPEKFSWF